MELDPYAWEFHEDPYPTYRWLRDQAPLYHNPGRGFFALSRFRDVVEASQDWRTYSSAEGTMVERMSPAWLEAVPLMIFLDPTRHDRLRRLVSHAFTPRRVAALEPFVRATAERLVDELVSAGEGDFVEMVATPLPMAVIFTLLGVADADRRRLRVLMDRALERDDATPQPSPRAVEALAALSQYWAGFVQEKRRTPDDGLVSALCTAEMEGDDGGRTRLGDAEIVGFCSLLGAAGNETVTKLLGNAALLFGRQQDEWAWVRDDPRRIPDAVEEVLRHSPPSQYQGRTVTRDVEWYGRTVPAGSRMLLLTGAACRDEREYPDPDRFDPRRRQTLALGFGQGVHFCLGASLARLESRVVLEELARRVPRFTVDEASAERVHMSNVHGFARLPVHIE